MKNLRYLIFFVIVTSCNFFGPIDKSSIKDIEKKPDGKDLYGEWKPDHFSYEFVQDQNIPIKKDGVLILNENHSFEIKDIPDLDYFRRYGKISYFNLKGVWEVRKSINKKYWELKLGSKTSNSEITEYLSLRIFNKKNTGLVFWKFFGDPDMGHRLMLIKNKE